MKRIFAIITLILTISCTSKNKVEDVAKSFLSNFYNEDLKKALKYASSETVEDINMIIENSPVEIVPLIKSEQYKVEIKEVSEEDDIAYCRYVVTKDENDAAAMSEVLVLIKEGDEWKAKF
ncbi:MAG: DUF4878 domain-containing protein [Rikenellaceae bacterium]